MTLVVDASVVVAALVDGGSDGPWAEGTLLSDRLAAPHLMPVEVASILRRLAHCGEVSLDVGALALADLESLSVDYFAFVPFTARVWELRENVTAYDAWYVALAEALQAPLATLDHRLARAAGPRCTMVSPTSWVEDDAVRRRGRGLT